MVPLSYTMHCIHFLNGLRTMKLMKGKTSRITRGDNQNCYIPRLPALNWLWRDNKGSVKRLPPKCAGAWNAKSHPFSHGGVDTRTDDFLRTKISWMHRLPNFLTHGAPLRALRARESSNKNSSTWSKYSGKWRDRRREKNCQFSLSRMNTKRVHKSTTHRGGFKIQSYF